MTKDVNKRLQFFKCSCGDVFRGENFHLHHKKNAAHSVAVKVWFCVWCNVRCDERNDAFSELHSKCVFRKISKVLMKKMMCGEQGMLYEEGMCARLPPVEVVNVEKRVVSDVDLDASTSKKSRVMSVSWISSDDECMNDDSSVAAAERELEKAVRAIVPVPEVLAQSTPRPSPRCVEKVERSTVPCEVVLSRDDVRAYTNVRHECTKLEGRVRSLKSTLKEVTAERDSLKLNAESVTQKLRECAAAKESMVKERKLKEEAVMKFEKCDRERSEERMLKEAALEEVSLLKNELARLKECEKVKSLTTMHIPIAGVVPDKPIVYLNISNDDTQECYSCADVRCYHVNIQHTDDIHIACSKPYKYREYND